MHHACASIQDVCLFRPIVHLCLFQWLKETAALCRFCSCSYCVCFTNGLLSPCLLFLSLSSHPFLPYHIHVFPLGLIKRLSSWGAGRRDAGGQWRRVVLITPYVWTGECGVEVLFQLINRDTVVLQSLCLSFVLSLSFPVSSPLHPLTPPLEIMCLLLIL